MPPLALSITVSGLSRLFGSSASTQSAQDLEGSSEARIDFDAESSVDDQSIDRWTYSYSEDGSGERLDAERRQDP